MKNECATLRQKLEKYEGLLPNWRQAEKMLAQVKNMFMLTNNFRLDLLNTKNWLLG
jgi:hypothetical protein